MTPDLELLHRYATQADEAAFAELVRRQIDLVYGVALRVTGGNATLAEEVTQNVFTDLARKAGPLSRHEALAGWLHTSARYAALTALRSEQRRRKHEQEASSMQDQPSAPETDWDRLRPSLDQAVGQLREKDRAAVVLRFFQGLSHREVGEELGLNENTARKRVDHALEKLRRHFARAGITVSSALLASTLSAHTLPPAPADLADRIALPSLARKVAGGTLASTIFTILFMSTKTKTALLVILAIAIATFIATHQFGPVPPNPAVKAGSAPIAATPIAVPLAPPSSKTAPILPGASADPASNNIPADLRAVLNDMDAMIKAGDLEGSMSKYAEPSNPSQVSTLTPQQQADRTQAVQQTITGPMRQQILQSESEQIQSMLNQSPDLNSAGDRATFHVETPAVSLPNGQIISPAETDPVVFLKIDGKWYLNSDSFAP